MRRAFLASAVLAGALLAAACSDQRSPLPTAPPVSPTFTASPCPRPVELAILILQLFAPRDLLIFAAQMHSDINLRMSKGDVAGARKVVLAFIDFTLKTYYQGKLRDPNGATPPGTDFFVVKLIDGLLCWVGLPPSGLALGPPGSSGTSVTTKVIGAEGGQFVANDGLSALQVPQGAVSADRLWVITRRDDLARLPAGCVTTSLEQIPLCVDFSVVPAQDLAQPVLVQICQPEDDHPAGRRLAHQLADNRIELLTEPPPPVEGQPDPDPFHLACLNLPTFPPVGLSPAGKALWQLGSIVTRVFGPKPAYASHAGLGGLVAPKLSSITAVRVRLGFMQQPTNTAPGAAITPPVTVAFLQVGTEGDLVAKEVTNPIRLKIGTNPAEGTLSGTTTQPPTSGASTFADLSINNAGVGYTLVADALSSSATGGVPLVIPVTSNAFDIGVPDLVVPSLTHSPPDPSTADLITFTAVVKNVGTATAGASHLGVTIGGETPGLPGTVIPVPALVPGATYSAARSLPLSVAQSYRNTAVADVNGEVTESNESNNTTTEDYSVASPPDLVIDQLTHAPSSPTAAVLITFTAVVKNVGAGPARASHLEFRIGGETPGAPATIFAIPALAPSAVFTVTRTMNLTAQAYENTATADVNHEVGETDETNNVRTDLYTVTSVLLLTASSCSLESGLRSINGTVSTSIEFLNRTSESVTVYWLNYQGTRVFYNTLDAGQSYVQQTYLTHPWVVIDAAGACLGIWLPADSPGAAVIGG